MLNIALPKGRLGEKVYAMFEASGYACPSIRENNRRLIFENAETGVRYFWDKPSDVAIYVERGAADIGVAGKKDFYDSGRRTLRVATKFPNIARQYYAGLGREIDIIKLNGSIELAPILGLSDVIVDIVETGTTLKENNLAVLETVLPISARLIANISAYKFKTAEMEQLTNQMKAQVEKK